MALPPIPPRNSAGVIFQPSSTNRVRKTPSESENFSSTELIKEIEEIKEDLINDNCLVDSQRPPTGRKFPLFQSVFPENTAKLMDVSFVSTSTSSGYSSMG